MRLDRVFYYTCDLDRAVRFHQDTLGLALHSRDMVARFVVDGLLLELVPTDDPALTSGAGNARLTFAVADLPGAVADLARQGVRVGAVRAVANGALAPFPDPDGSELVLWQYAAPRPETAA